MRGRMFSFTSAQACIGICSWFEVTICKLCMRVCQVERCVETNTPSGVVTCSPPLGRGCDGGPCQLAPEALCHQHLGANFMCRVKVPVTLGTTHISTIKYTLLLFFFCFFLPQSKGRALICIHTAVTRLVVTFLLM